MAKRRGRPPKNQQEPIIEDVETAVIEEVEPEVVDNSSEEVINTDTETDNQQFNPDDTAGTFGNYDPLSDNVIEREYSTPKVVEGLSDDIPEPNYGSDVSFEDLMNSTQEEKEPEPSPFDNPNPELNDLPPDEKRIACESMVDTVLDTYASLLKMGSNFVKLKDDKLASLIANDEIDGTMSMPLENGEEVSLQEFFNSYNEQVEETLEYDREFGLKVRPAMIRVFIKKGWGMTDEQFLYFMWGKELLYRGSQVFTLVKTMNGTVNLLKEIHQTNKDAIPTAKAEPVYEAEPEIRVRKESKPPVQEVYIDDETEIGQGLDNSEYEEVRTQKMNIHEFKRPDQTTHPDLVQKEMDKANAEAKSNSNKSE